MKQEDNANDLLSVKVMSWNVLADCYVPPYKKRIETYFLKKPFRSNDETNLQELSERFKWEKRSLKIKQVIERAADILCLQEVDHCETFYEPTLLGLGYHFSYCKRPNDKSDGVLIAWKQDLFDKVNELQVDLNEVCSKEDTITQKNNVGLVCTLKDKRSEKVFVVATCHLHWNPKLEELRLMQATFFLDKVHLLVSQACDQHGLALEALPYIVCGDFNSLPSSKVYTLLKTGCHEIKGERKGFVCDASLGKVAKYLRAVGISAIHVTTSNTSTEISLLDELKVRREYQGRIFLTTSKRLYQRRDCPLSSMLIKSQATDNCFQQVIKETGYELCSSDFYTICVKCNGKINPVNRNDIPSSRISQLSYVEYRVQTMTTTTTTSIASAATGPNQVPQKIYNSSEEMISMCDDCGQLFWWDDDFAFTSNRNKKSSSARMKSLVQRLEELSLNSKAEQDGSTFLAESAGQVSYRSKILSQQARQYRVKLKLVDSIEHEESLRLNTNFTLGAQGFKGCLDYVFYAPGSLSLVSSAITPSFPPTAEPQYLPSDSWPSDHCCVLAEFLFK